MDDNTHTQQQPVVCSSRKQILCFRAIQGKNVRPEARVVHTEQEREDRIVHMIHARRSHSPGVVVHVAHFVLVRNPVQLAFCLPPAGAANNACKLG